MNIFNDKEGFKCMFVDIMSNNNGNVLMKKIHDKLTSNAIDSDLDNMLIELGSSEPYSFIVPHMRYYLGFTGRENEDYANKLRIIKRKVHAAGGDMHVLDTLDTLIDFLTKDVVIDLSLNEEPAQLLVSIIDKIPDSVVTVALDCVEYLHECIEECD